MRSLLSIFVAIFILSSGSAIAASTSTTGSTGGLGFTCTYDPLAPDDHTCSCEGVIDCDDMRESNVCRRDENGTIIDILCTQDGCICGARPTKNQDMPEEEEEPGNLTDLGDAGGAISNQAPEEEEDDPISRSELPGLEDVARPSAGSGFPVPSDVVVSNRGSRGTLGVSWQDNSSTEEGFYVERLISRSSGNWETAATSRSRDGNVEGTGSRRRTLRNQGDEATLCYRVRAYRGDEVSAPSETVCSRSQ